MKGHLKPKYKMAFRFRTLSVSILILLFCQFSKAQDPDLIMDNTFPPSPEATALGKYGEYPVGLYTGIPSISIPIWDISTKQIKVPVSISYHGSGIRIDEISTNVGLGWTLNAGGAITRSVRGLPDDDQNGYYYALFNEDNIDSSIYIDNISDGLRDGEADIFYFNIGGYSGRFFFNLDNEIILAEKQELQIKVYEGSFFLGFTIITPDGNKYHFGNNCENCSGEDYREETQTTDEDHMNVRTYYSTWYLRKIESLNGEVVDFIYESIGMSDKLQSIQQSVALSADFVVTANDESKSYTYVLNQKRIDAIKFSRSSVNFNYNTARLDITNGNSLDEIEIQNSNQEEIRSYNLYHSYFPCDYSHRYAYRLRLDSIVEIGENNLLEKTTKFDYYTDQNIPPRRHTWIDGQTVTANEYFSQDHWGYFNGESNTSLVPSLSYEAQSYTGANRDPHWPYSKANILEKITYPTGGYTSFEFEPNYIGYQGKDTVDSYYDEADLTGNMDHCDEMYTMVCSDTFEIHDSDFGIVDFSMTLDKTHCSDQASSPAFTLSVLDLSTSTVDTSITLNDDPTLLESSVSGTFSLDSGQYYIRTIYHKNARFTWALTYNKHFDDVRIFDREYDEFGGVRIKSIKNYDSNDSLELSKEYQYLTAKNSGESSGQVISRPSYFEIKRKLSTYPPGTYKSSTPEIKSFPGPYFKLFFVPLDLQLIAGITRAKADGDSIAITGITIASGEVILSSTPTYELGSTQGGIVGYASVFENNNEGEIQHFFSSFSDYPELQCYCSKIGIGDGGSYYKYSPTLGDNTVFPYSPIGNMDQFRGKLLGKLYLDKNDSIVLKQEYYYTQIHQDSYYSLKASPNISISGDQIIGTDEMASYVKYKNTSAFYPLVKKVETQYADGAEIIISTSEYDFPDQDNYQTTEEKSFLSSGDSIRRLFYYPYDSEVSNNPNSSALTDSNKVQSPLRIDEYFNISLTSQKVTDFNVDLLPDTIKDYDFDVSDFRTLKLFTQYDGANLLEFIDADGITTAVIWGYEEQYPIVIAQNVSYSTLNTAVLAALSNVGYSSLEQLCIAASSSTTIMTGIWKTFTKHLHDNTSLSDAMVTTFLHKPLVGKICETGPGLISTYYEYDGLGRLLKVFDNDRNIIQEHEYNYAQ